MNSPMQSHSDRYQVLESLPAFRKFAGRFPKPALLLTVALLAGFNQKLGHPDEPGTGVTLTFSLNDKPLTQGQVDLSGNGGGTEITAEGAKFAHVPFGKYKVVVHPPAAPPIVETTPDPKTAIAIPPKYRDERKTPLEIDLQESGPRTFNLEIKK